MKLGLEVLALATVIGRQRLPTQAIRALLFDRRLSEVMHAHLMRLVGHGSRWRPDLVTLEFALEILSAKHLAPHRQFLLGNVVERLAFTAPNSFTLERFRRLQDVYRGYAPFRYLAYFLAGRPDTPAKTAREAARLFGTHFPLHAIVRSRLGTGPRRALVVHNINDGQGDELVRVGPLTQALLDFNPKLHVTVMARRTYLYEHPRVTPISIADALGTEATLREDFDVVVHLFEPTPGIAYRPEVDAPVEEYVRTRSPFIHLGARKALNHFVFDTVTVDATPCAQRLGVDQRRVRGVYEATCRLIADLGLPLRAGEETPRAGFLHAGTRSVQAEKEWRRLVGPSRRGQPTILVNPFGGQEPLKGYRSEQFDDLAHELALLVGEGRRVVLVTNGMPWGSAALAEDVVSRLPADLRPHVSITPDPVPDLGPGRPRAPDVRADEGMRLLKRFVSYADHVVTVEGWMMHMAYQLGRPHRVLVMPYSHVSGWYPHGANRNQVVAMDIAATPRAWPTELRSLPEGPPTPSYPRKQALEMVLRGLGKTPDPSALPFLLRVEGGPDQTLRAVAIEALARGGGPEATGCVRAALREPSAAVRAAAARGLLADPTLSGTDALTLRCHILIQARNWLAVWGFGKGALPALSVAVGDTDPVVRREAQWLFWRIVGGLPASLRSATEG